MKLTGEYVITAPREKVWALLNDPDVLRECLPGCEELHETETGGLSARVTTKIGPVKATFNGTVELQDVKPPESYRIAGEGQGGVAGFAKGTADVRLAEDGETTILTYDADAQVGGKLAQLGNRLVGSTVKKLADQFFSCLAEKAGGHTVKAGEAAPAGVAADEAALSEPAGTAAIPGATVPPLATGVPEVGGQETAAGTSSEARREGEHESAFSHAAHELEHAAEEAEEAVEERAAGGFLGGPMVWGFIAILVLIALWAIL
ncbi:carbon monoxide dehydrogenase subunit G [Afifella sp. H1R]|uniref:SRPBCC family protein n=1 Tax=Afifella sp. H1R TaxID=2908841 RepID=UPI001F3EC41C|nr:carbon monoxide dehydrogenase subunit G [Afifella sp. H1R]MCF1504337.1 carbon monoxide dehydrogenase subunit G [Afifella sp. H1R]